MTSSFEFEITLRKADRADPADPYYHFGCTPLRASRPASLSGVAIPTSLPTSKCTRAALINSLRRNANDADPGDDNSCRILKLTLWHDANAYYIGIE
jgi:hypothetical protein